MSRPSPHPAHSTTELPTPVMLAWSLGFFALACASGVVGFALPIDSPALESLGGALFLTWMIAALVALMFDSSTEI